VRTAPVRRLQRAAKWVGFSVLAACLAAAAPVAYVEGSCAGRTDPAWQGGSRFPAIPAEGYRRAAGDTYLAYPEAHLAHSHADLAAAIEGAGESGYGHATAISGYWSSLCGATRAASRTGDVTPARRVGSHAAGLGFTAQMAVSGLYERSIGALSAWWRGPVRTAEDDFEARAASAFAESLHRAPWYAHAFTADLSGLWGDVPFEPSVRAVERRLALTLGYAGRSLLSWAAASAVGFAGEAGTGPETIRSVVEGVDVTDAAADPRLAPIGSLPPRNGVAPVLVETPRNPAFTEVLRGLGGRGRTVVEIAGNRRILTTVLVPEGREVAFDGAYPLFTVPVPSRPGWRRVGYDSEVGTLLRQIRSAEAQGGRFERAYDY
jgi:hypothetical protein